MSFIHNYKIMNYIFFGTIILNLQQNVNLHFFITVKLAQLPIQLMVNIQSKKKYSIDGSNFP